MPDLGRYEASLALPPSYTLPPFVSKVSPASSTWLARLSVMTINSTLHRHPRIRCAYLSRQALQISGEGRRYSMRSRRLPDLSAFWPCRRLARLDNAKSCR